MQKGRIRKHEIRNEKIRKRWEELKLERPQKSKDLMLDILAAEFGYYGIGKRRIEDIAYGAD